MRVQEEKGFFSLGRKGNGPFGKDVQEPGKNLETAEGPQK